MLSFSKYGKRKRSSSISSRKKRKLSHADDEEDNDGTSSPSIANATVYPQRAVGEKKPNISSVVKEEQDEDAQELEPIVRVKKEPGVRDDDNDKSVRKRRRTDKEREGVRKRVKKERTHHSSSSSSSRSAASEELKRCMEEDAKHEEVKKEEHMKQCKDLDEWCDAVYKDTPSDVLGDGGSGGGGAIIKVKKEPGSDTGRRSDAMVRALLTTYPTSKKRGPRKKVKKEVENEKLERKMHNEDFLKLSQAHLDSLTHTMSLLGVEREALEGLIRDLVAKGSECARMRIMTWLKPKVATQENAQAMLRDYNDLARKFKEVERDLKRTNERLKKFEEIVTFHKVQTEYVAGAFWCKVRDVNSLIPAQVRQEPLYRECGERLISFPLRSHGKER